MPNQAHSNQTEVPMTQFASTTTVRRTLVSTFGALILAAALPQAGLAATSDDGLWKINPAKSSFGSGSATLSIERVASANPGAGSFIVVAKGSVYLVKRASVGDSKGLQPADYARMTSEGSATLIGTNAKLAAVTPGMSTCWLVNFHDSASPLGLSVNSTLLWASNGLRKSSLSPTFDGATDSVTSMLPWPTFLSPFHA